MNAHKTTVISGRVLLDPARQRLVCESGAEATALQTLRDGLESSEFREAFGLRRVYRRFSSGGNEIFSVV